MIKILFICHGNICRSTMSQFVFQDMVNKKVSLTIFILTQLPPVGRKSEMVLIMGQ